MLVIVSVRLVTVLPGGFASCFDCGLGVDVGCVCLVV